MVEYFSYSAQEIDYLRGKDKRLREAIDTIGPIRREVVPDLFEALVHSIVGQQIATKAQITIWNRMRAAFGTITPAAVLAMEQAELQAFGISMRKAGYIRGAAEKIANGELDLEALQRKSDTEVCVELSALKGIGVWTAEMLMTFSMQRRDIFSYGDLAIHRGLRMLYRHKQIDPARFERFRKRYSPCGSVASLYLWAVASGALPGLTDPAAPQKR